MRGTCKLIVHVLLLFSAIQCWVILRCGMPMHSLDS
jgi:hypothetical protein